MNVDDGTFVTVAEQMAHTPSMDGVMSLDFTAYLQS